jgi:3-oxoacyl-[acyl-carrier protein] reductase
MGKLQNKVAIVSGSGRGIGKAIALKLASEGAAVVVNDIDENPGLETVAEIQAAGGRAVACNGNVTAADFGERFVKTALDGFGGLDIIVNNAGYTWDGMIQKMSDDQFQAMLDVHALAPFRILRAAAEPIRLLAKKEAAEGREVFRKVVNVSSIVGLTGNPGQTNYAAAKAGLNGMTHSLSKEWGRYKVNVNGVAFACIETRLAQAVTGDKPKVRIGDHEIELGIPAAMVEASKAFIPLGRWGTVAEAADAVYLFCSPESNFISGQIITVGGGMVA